MSCHDIGHGLNEVVRTVLKEYDAGQIAYEPTFRILMQCRQSVHWCDGNEYEATACMYDRCCHCLRTGLPMFSLHIDYDDRTGRDLVGDKAIDRHLCQECIDNLGFQQYVEKPWDVEAARHYDYYG